MEKFSDEEKVMIYTIGTCQDLKAKGLLEGGEDLTPEGYQEYLNLKATGFRPEAGEIQDCMRAIQSQYSSAPAALEHREQR